MISFQAHETAVIDEDCLIGKGTRIWHFSHVMKGAVISDKMSLFLRRLYLGETSKCRIMFHSIRGFVAKTMFFWDRVACLRIYRIRAVLSPGKKNTRKQS